MLLTLSKLIPAVLFPAGLVVILCLIAAYFAFRKGARRAGSAALLAAVVMYLASSPLVSNRLMVGLEKQNPPLLENPRASAIVLLGGGMAPMLEPRVHPETGAAGDRVIHAARLWRQGLAPIVVPTGGYIGFMMDAPGSEADLYARLLTEVFGLPDSAIMRMGRSRTTHEDAAFTALLFDSTGLGKDILLVTSASHMPRASALFRNQGFTVHAAPTDYRGNLNAGFKMFNLLPSGSALAETTTALHEYVGLWAYRMMGRL
jgi:uncharacterized SAM-binding protein YcdF (DUF218 family)